MAATTLAVIVKSMKSPLSLRSSGSIEMPAAMESAGLCGRSSRPSTSTLPDWIGPRAEDRLADLRAPGAEQAGEADDLAVAHREGRRDHRLGDEVADLERDGRIRGGATRIGLEGKLAPDHQRDQLAVRHRSPSRARR